MLFNLIRLVLLNLYMLIPWCWLWGILSNRQCCSTWTGLYCDVDCGSKRLSSNCTSVLLNFDMVIRSCYLRFIMSKKNWWYHRGNKKLIIEGQTMPWPKRDKKINNGQHNTTPKTKDWATRILHKPRVNSGTPEE